MLGMVGQLPMPLRKEAVQVANPNLADRDLDLLSI